MKHWERVAKAISLQEPDRVPYGELQIPLSLAARYLGVSLENISREDKFNIRKEFIQAMDMDLVVVPGYKWQNGQSYFREESLADIERWRRETDLFTFGLVNGGFGQTLCTYGLHELLPLIDKEPVETTKMIESVLAENIKIAEKLVASGAQAIIVGDDFAYAKSTFVSPIVLRHLVFRALGRACREIKSWGVPAFLHVDGNINMVLEDIMELGISGLHSIQPSAGMDIAEVKAKYGHKICLMGNLDLELFYNDDKESLEEAIRNLIKVAAPGGGFILSTSSGLEEGIVPGQLSVLKEVVLEQGKYRQV